MCVRGSPMVPLAGNIFTNGTIDKEIGASGKNGNTIVKVQMLPTNGDIGKEIGANGKNGYTIVAKDTNVTNH